MAEMLTAIPEAALDTTMAIVGRTGSGKTYAAGGGVERLLHMRRQVVILDPTGVWWGLRTMADGKSPGFAVPVLGGDHGDLQLPSTAGDALARQIITGRMSVVLDTSLFTMGERRRFYTALLERLYADNRQVLHLVVDEADELAPQNPQPDQTVVLNRLDQIVRRGRVKGFRTILITQRPAVLNKNVLSQAGALLALKLPSPQDRKAIAGWIEGQADKSAAKAMIDRLPSLPTGEGFCWFPERDPAPQPIRFPQRMTFDSGRTPAPGEAAPSRQLPGAGIDLAALKAALAAEPDQPAAGGPRGAGAADRRVVELERQVAELQAEVKAAIGARVALLDGLRGFLDATEAPAAAAPAPRPPAPPRAAPPRAAPAPRAAAPAGEGLHAAGVSLLAVLVRHHPARWTWGQLATLAGLKARGGHFNAGRAALRGRDLVEEAGDLVGAAKAALAGAPKGQAARTPAERRTLWTGVLPAPAPLMINALAERGAEWTTPEQLSKRISAAPRGGHWNSGLAMLRGNGLAERDSAGRYRLVKELRDA